MNRLTENEYKNIQDLLSIVSDEDVLDIAKAISKGSVCFESVQEAVEVILSLSSSIESVLGRKKLKNDYLIKYLWSKGISVKTNTDRIILLKEITKLWSHGTQLAVPSNPHRVPVQPHPESSGALQALPGPMDLAPCDPDVLPLATEFVTWFFDMINSGTTEFGPQHFWPNCVVKVEVSWPGEHVEEIHEGDEASAAVFVAMRGSGLTLDCGILSGTTGSSRGALCAKRTDFGGIAVQAKGTAHRCGRPTGVFLTNFGLIRDPSVTSRDKETYRIKECHLGLKLDSPLHRTVH